MLETRFDEAKAKIQAMGFIDDVETLEAILREFEDISDNSKAIGYVEDGFMPSKVGNTKIGNDTLIINVNHAFNCFSDKSGYCEHCNDCYAKKAPNTYPNSFLYGFASEINFNKLSIDEIINSIKKAHKEDLKANKIKFLRFNEAGDFKSLDLFLKANEVAKYFKEHYNIISYTYTHNKELLPYKDMIKNSYIVMNWSIKAGNGFKQAITCNKASDLAKYLSDKENYVICKGKCHNCSYCKDKTDLRTVVFVNHFKQTIEAGLKAGLEIEDINRLEAQKYIDYGLFLMKLTNQTTLI
jgi:hypothetical protein